MLGKPTPLGSSQPAYALPYSNFFFVKKNNEYWASVTKSFHKNSKLPPMFKNYYFHFFLCVLFSHLFHTNLKEMNWKCPCRYFSCFGIFFFFLFGNGSL